MRKNDNVFTKILIGFLLIMLGPVGLIAYNLGKRSERK